MTSGSYSILRGIALAEHLDRLEADLEESPSADAMNLLARLRAQSMQADSLDAIERLHTLWMQAGDPSAALAVVTRDGDALLDASAPSEQVATRMRLLLTRLRITQHVGDETGIREALSGMRTAAAELPPSLAERYKQLSLLETIESNTPTCGLDAVETRYAMALASSNHDVDRTFALIDYHRRRAQVFRHTKQLDEARVAAHDAIAALTDAPPGNSVDAQAWVWLGEALIDIVPNQLVTIEEHIRHHIATLSLPQQREFEVRIARFRARVAYAHGDLEGALDACNQARYSLEPGGGDDFIEHELTWLIEAGRFDAAGRRAFFNIYDCEEHMWPGAARIVHERLANLEDTSVWWVLCALRACNTPGTLSCFLEHAGASEQAWRNRSSVHEQLFGKVEGDIDDSARDFVSDAARNLAEARAPGHPWVHRLTLVDDCDKGRISADDALEQLQTIAQQAGMYDRRTQYSILKFRKDAHGFVSAIQQPVPVVESGEYAYSFGVYLSELADECLLPAVGPDWREDQNWMRAQNFVMQMYEQGLAHFELYFKAGRGHAFSACAHTYSMLCNNLAILYEHTFDRVEDAIALHEKGIAASSFAEHYDGILCARTKMNDWEGVVRGAEQLWHFSAEHGFSRHNPRKYIPDVVRALNKLDRDREIPMWLERLVNWEHQCGEDDAVLSPESLYARISVNTYMEALPEEGFALWRQLEPQVRKSKDYIVWADASAGASRRNDFALALELIHGAIALNPCDTPFARNQIADHRKRVATFEEYLKEKADASKPWWKFW